MKREGPLKHHLWEHTSARYGVNVSSWSVVGLIDVLIDLVTARLILLSGICLWQPFVQCLLNDEPHLRPRLLLLPMLATFQIKQGRAGLKGVKGCLGGPLLPGGCPSNEVFYTK